MKIHQAIAKKLLVHLDSNTTVITPNRRLSATLHQFYQQQQIQQQKNYWQTPHILPVLSWLESLWLEYIGRKDETLPYLLNPAQEQFIWQNILAHHKKSEKLLKLSDTANLVQSAFKLLIEWQVDSKHPSFQRIEDYCALKDWIDHFKHLCHEQHWIVNADLPLQLMEKDIFLPQKIILFGFSELSPLMQKFLAHCQRRGVKTTNITGIDLQAKTTRVTLNHPDDEIYSMAKWALTTYRQHAKQFSYHESLEIRIGCVLPQLDKIRNRVAQIFTEVFADSMGQQCVTYNISAGRKLTDYPVIDAAFQILHLTDSAYSSDALWFLLSTPFIGHADSERNNRAKFDFVLRQENCHALDINVAKHKALIARYCPKLLAQLEQLYLNLKAPNLELTAREWAKYFNHLLTTIGWPGERSLNSEEFQTVDQWLKLLNQFISLDEVSKPLNCYQALQALQQAANKQIFQPKTPDAAIQILGILEAAALPFDFLWIAGIDDLNWPPHPKPNPFIPHQLQRDLQMPHATAERELEYCEQLTEQFKKSTHQLIFSYARKHNDVEVQISPLIANVTEDFALLKYAEQANLSMKIFQTQKIEILKDELANALSANDIITGGTNVLKLQSLCPFRAFSEYRLHAKELQKREFGMRAKERGTIIHRILERIWRELHDHETLVQMPEEQLKQLITNKIEEILNDITMFAHLKSRYITLEKERLYHLMSQWLAFEKKRAPFKVIAIEKATKMAIDKIELSIKIDRVDELKGGKHLIIDYKTSKNNNINTCFDDRPEEIQLPLYALTNPDCVTGITYAQITPSEYKFNGVSDFNLGIKGIRQLSAFNDHKATWEDQIQQWQSNIQRLAKDYTQGVACVDPKDKDKTCLYCKLKSLCRLYEEVAHA